MKTLKGLGKLIYWVLVIICIVAILFSFAMVWYYNLQDGR